MGNGYKRQSKIMIFLMQDLDRRCVLSKCEKPHPLIIGTQGSQGKEGDGVVGDIFNRYFKADFYRVGRKSLRWFSAECTWMMILDRDSLRREIDWEWFHLAVTWTDRRRLEGSLSTLDQGMVSVVDKCFGIISCPSIQCYSSCCKSRRLFF